MSQSVPRPIDTGTPQQAYNHIGRSDSIGSAHSLGSFSMVSESALSYSRLERLPSWGSHTSSSTYPRDQYNTLSSVQTENTIQEGSYDRLARSPSTSSRNFSQSLVSVAIMLLMVIHLSLLFLQEWVIVLLKINV